MKLEQKRWFFLAVNVLINICIGAGYAWSVFQNPLMQAFGWSGAQASLAFTLIMGVSALPMAAAGKLQELIRPKWIMFFGGLLYGLCMFFTGFIQSLAGLYLLFGVGCGIGQGVIYSTGISNMVRLFPDRRGLCSGLMAAGMGSGATLIAPLAAACITRYGPLAAFRILGVSFTVILCGLSLLIPTASPHFQPEGWDCSRGNGPRTGVADVDWRGMLREPLFYMIAGMFAAGTISGMMIIGHASPIFQQMGGVSAQEAAILVGMLSICNTAGRLFWGMLSDRMGRYRVVFALYVVVVVSMTGLSFATALALFNLAMLLVAFCYGGFMALMASLTADAFGAKHLPVNFGIMFLAYGASSFIGPRLAAAVQEMSGGSYTKAFVAAGACAFVGIALTAAAGRRAARRRSAAAL